MRGDNSNPTPRWLLHAALPTVIVLAILTIAGKISGIGAALLWLAVLVSGTWYWLGYHRDMDAERQQGRLSLLRRNGPISSNQGSAFLFNLVEGLSDPLILLDMKSRVIHANRAAKALLGDGIVGKDISFYLRNPTALKAIEQAAIEKVAKEQEFTLLDPVERSCLMRVNVINIGESFHAAEISEADANESERAQYLLLSILDISQIKLAEKMRVDFVANASHELRTPLASVIGFIETLQGPAAEDAGARNRFLSIMMAEATRMHRLIDDLLSLSKIEMDQHQPPETAVDLPLVIKSLAHTLELRGGAKIKLEIPDDLPSIRGDRDQLTQVFQNLIDNAIKYGRPDTPVEITVRPIERLPNRTEPGVSVTVFNAGDGIPAEHIPRLTERFYRVDNARSRKMGGTGLGLAIVKHIITRHRGALTIASIIGTGTTITVSLPLYKSKEINS